MKIAKIFVLVLVFTFQSLAFPAFAGVCTYTRYQASGARYEISFWNDSSDCCKPTSGYAMIEFYDSEGNYRDYFYVYSSVVQSWYC